MESPPHINGLANSPAEPDMLDDSDVEAELEVDQLDSDTDPEVDTAKITAPRNSHSIKPGERIPGHTLLPAARLENIIQADGVTGNMALSKEGLYVLSIATEEFIKRLIQAAHREASAHRRNQINFTDMAATAQQYQEFMVLADTIPAPVTLADAFVLRQEKERELLEDNPALAVPYSGASAIPSPDPEPSISVPKPQKKSRAPTANGKEKEKTNGSASTSSAKRGSKKSSKSNSETPYPASASTPQTSHLQWPDHPNGQDEEHPRHHRRSSRNGVSSASTPSLPPPPPPMSNDLSLGLTQAQASQYTPEGGYDMDSIHSPPRDPDSRSQTPPYGPGGGGPSWPGQFTGPASGFLRGSVAPYGRPAQNPGRTIYSQNHHPD